MDRFHGDLEAVETPSLGQLHFLAKPLNLSRTSRQEKCNGTSRAVTKRNKNQTPPRVTKRHHTPHTTCHAAPRNVTKRRETSRHATPRNETITNVRTRHEMSRHATKRNDNKRRDTSRNVYDASRTVTKRREMSRHATKRDNTEYHDTRRHTKRQGTPETPPNVTKQHTRFSCQAGRGDCNRRSH